MPVFIESYACLTAFGESPESLYSGLLKGNPAPSQKAIFRIPDGSPSLTSQERLIGRLVKCWQDLKHKPSPLSRVGILFASTKGMIEDLVWKSEPPRTDPLTPVLELFTERSELKPKFSMSVSNACASSHAAVYVAKKWLEADAVDSVLILAADEIGPLIQKGFQSLGALSLTQAKPFSEERDGLQLGEAAAVIHLSKTPGALKLLDVEIDTEGHSITRPSPSGKSLSVACEKVISNVGKISGVVAHGTATRANDLAEEECFRSILKEQIPITANKWAVGHTLGASGAIDLIVACESIRHGRLPAIGTTKKIDPAFSNSYVIEKSKTLSAAPKILVTSLGFGGTHAALVLGS